ncbi:MAG: glycosyltransferase [Candidatus Marinimicrobia bacterium]|nr:glycosyltransferase [Candidatus Neomarinimicrobiota bacterium]
MATTSILFHFNTSFGQSEGQRKAMVDAMVHLRNKDVELIGITNDSETLKKLVNTARSLKTVPAGSPETLASMLNKALKVATGEFILLLDNVSTPVLLRKASVDTFLMAAERHPEAGLFYSSYELEDHGCVEEKHLLDHHIGRVRDNMDFGKAFFIRKKTLESIGGFDESVKYNVLYDMRLKLSERQCVIRIANRYNGSLYRVQAAEKKANVFDYLLSGKEIQLEAEKVVTEHLKRIDAYLPPGIFRDHKPAPKKDPALIASVIIPVGYRPEFIGTAIESVQEQTIKDIECIVMVNGGDEDPTAEVVRKYMKGGEKYDATKPEIRLVVLDINNIGLCLNIGAKLSRAKYYVQLDSDDRLKPDAVEKVLDVFHSDPEIGMVIGSYEVWEKKESGELVRMKEIPVVTHNEWTEENGRNNLLRINGAGAPRCIPIHVIKEMGYFSINDDTHSRNYGEDYEMVNKIAEYYRIGRVWEPIYEVVRHSGGTDHAIDQHTIDRNDNAKDDMRRETILRRQLFNRERKKA